MPDPRVEAALVAYRLSKADDPYDEQRHIRRILAAADAVDGLGSFASLKPGWDSYDAKPISEEAIHTARALTFVPCADGGIQIELHAGGADLEVVIDPDGTLHDPVAQADRLAEALRAFVNWRTTADLNAAQEPGRAALAEYDG